MLIHEKILQLWQTVQLGVGQQFYYKQYSQDTANISQDKRNVRPRYSQDKRNVRPSIFSRILAVLFVIKFCNYQKKRSFFRYFPFISIVFHRLMATHTDSVCANIALTHMPTKLVRDWGCVLVLLDRNFRCSLPLL